MVFIIVFIFIISFNVYDSSFQKLDVASGGVRHLLDYLFIVTFLFVSFFTVLTTVL